MATAVVLVPLVPVALALAAPEQHPAAQTGDGEEGEGAEADANGGAKVEAFGPPRRRARSREGASAVGSDGGGREVVDSEFDGRELAAGGALYFGGGVQLGADAHFLVLPLGVFVEAAFSAVGGKGERKREREELLSE